MSQLLDIARNEANLIINHISRIIIKDQHIADYHETQESLGKSYDYIAAYTLTLDRLPDETDVGYLKRMENMVISYEELPPYSNPANPHEENKYYKDLLINNKIRPGKARLALDFALIYQPDFDTNTILIHFESEFEKCARYFRNVIYSKALEDMQISNLAEDGYRNFCKFFICIMTLVQLLNTRLKNPFDANLMNEQLLDNFFYSFGFTQFKTLSVTHKRLLLNNFNKLIRHKGTDQVLIDILEVFDFKNISIFKHYLVKDHSSSNFTKSNNDKTVYSQPRFISHNINISSINKAIKQGSYREDTFESITSGDPYWEADINSVNEYNFDYVQSKYFSIESSFDLYKETLNTVYFLNYIQQLTRLDPQFENHQLEVYAKNISTNPIKIVDIIVAVQVLTLNLFKIEDVIVYSESKTRKIYQFNNKDEYERNLELFGVSHLSPDSELKDQYILSNLKKYMESDLDKFQNSDSSVLFRKQMIAKEKIIESIRNEFDYKKFKAKIDAYNYKFVSDYNLEHFKPYLTYSDYVESKNTDLHNYISVGSDTESIVRNKIIELSDILSEYSKDLSSLLTNTLSVNTLMDIITFIVNIFKSYTVDINTMKVVLIARDQYFFKLLDSSDISTKIQLKTNFNISINDNDIASGHLYNTRDSLKINDHYRYKIIYNYIDNLSLTNKDKFTNRSKFIRYDPMILKDRMFNMNNMNFKDDYLKIYDTTNNNSVHKNLEKLAFRDNNTSSNITKMLIQRSILLRDTIKIYPKNIDGYSNLSFNEIRYNLSNIRNDDNHKLVDVNKSTGFITRHEMIKFKEYNFKMNSIVDKDALLMNDQFVITVIN